MFLNAIAIFENNILFVTQIHGEDKDSGGTPIDRTNRKNTNRSIQNNSLLPRSMCRTQKQVQQAPPRRQRLVDTDNFNYLEVTIYK